jgi:hypothetical protein
MVGGRRRRFAKVFPHDREAIEGAASKLRDAMIQAKIRLVPFNEHYSALDKLGDEMRIALNIIADRPPDHRDPIVSPARTTGGPQG